MIMSGRSENRRRSAAAQWMQSQPSPRQRLARLAVSALHIQRHNTGATGSRGPHGAVASGGAGAAARRCVSVDLVFFGLAAMDGLHTEGMTEDRKGSRVQHREVSKLVPRKHTFGSQDDLSAVGGDGLQKRFRGGLHVPVQQAFHRPGRGCTRTWCGHGGRCRRKRGCCLV